MAAAPFAVKEVLTLQSCGIKPKLKSLNMESQKYICVVDSAPQNNVLLIDMNVPMQPLRQHITADSALMCHNSSLLAFKAELPGTTQDHLQIFNIEMNETVKSHHMAEKVVFWKWISAKKLALVTERSCHHWLIEGESEPVKVFDRIANLSNKQIINYHCDPSEKWLVLIGIGRGPPERPKLAKGIMQLYSVDKQRSQPLEAHAASFATFKVPGNENPSTLISFATKSSNAGKISSKLHVIELGPQPGKPSFTMKQADLFFPPDFADDFPVSIEISQKYNFIYVITMQGLLFVYDLETATAVYRNCISQHPIFLTTETSSIGGFYAINKQGQVLLATVNEATIIPFISGQLSNLELAVNLAKRGNLPGAENLLGMYPSSSPWVLVTPDNTNEHLPFLMRTDGEIIRTLPELKCKSIVNFSAGWLILVDEHRAYSILNLVTLHYFKFPIVKMKSNPKFSLLLFPPCHPQIKLVVYQSEAASFMCCCTEDMVWREHQALGDTSYAQDDNLVDPVVCGGRLFCHTWRSGIIVEINVDDFSIKKLPIKLPDFFQLFPMLDKKYMLVESGDQLFVVCLAGRLAERAGVGLYSLEPTALEVSRLNFSRMAWEKTDRLENRAFFIGEKYQFSHHSAEPIIETSNAYCFYFSRKSFYSFNMEQKTILVSFPLSNIPTSNMRRNCLDWVMPAVSFRGDKGRNESLTQLIKKEVREAAQGRFSRLPVEILQEISRSLILHDYVNFRSLNRTCWLAIPSIQWTTTAWNDFKLDGALSPWLVFGHNASLTCIEPLHGERIQMRIECVPFSEMRICYSKNGWLVILHGKNSIFLWNGFSKKFILLPNMLEDCDSIISCCFSTSPHWKDCNILMVSFDGHDFNVQTINLDERVWREAVGFDMGEFQVTSANSPVFLDGNFYFLGNRGDLGVVRELANFEVLQRPVCPCESFHQGFLLEISGKLLSVFVGPFGEWVRLFTLDGSGADWVELKDIGSRVLYLSSFSSFSLTDPTRAKGNRIYVPRLSGKNLVYYSPDSKRFHSEGTKDVLLGFYNTSEQSLGGWLELKWWS